MTLTTQQRESILTKIQSLVAEKYFDPAFDNSAWQAIVARNRPVIVGASSTADFDECDRKDAGGAVTKNTRASLQSHTHHAA